jgi:hypothetical protein
MGKPNTPAPIPVSELRAFADLLAHAFFIYDGIVARAESLGVQEVTMKNSLSIPSISERLEPTAEKHLSDGKRALDAIERDKSGLSLREVMGKTLASPAAQKSEKIKKAKKQGG